jgi:integrase
MSALAVLDTVSGEQEDRETPRDPLAGLIGAWLHEKTATSGSARTLEAYQTTLARFRAVLQAAGLDLDGGADGPGGGDAVRIAEIAQWWSTQPWRAPRRAQDHTQAQAEPAAQGGVVAQEAAEQAVRAVGDVLEALGAGETRREQARVARQVAATTTNQRLAILSSFYTFARKRRMLPADLGNPIELIQKPKMEAYEDVRALPMRLVTARLAAIDRATPAGCRDYALLTLALRTGRRRNELAGLLLGDIEGLAALGTDEHEHEHGLGTATLTLHWRTTGAKRQRDVLEAVYVRPLMAWLAQIYGPDLADVASVAATAPERPVWVSLSQQNRGAPLSGRALRDLCRKRLGTTKVHALRHTAAAMHDALGASVTEIRDQLGHSSVATTDRYLRKLKSGQNAYGGGIASLLGME